VRRFDFINLVVYVVQFLISIPCFWLMTPVIQWLKNECHWHSWAAKTAAILFVCILWVVLIVLITFIYGYIRVRRQGKDISS
jgi:hypothetical protein